MNDEPRDDLPQDPESGPQGDYPAPWSRREEGTVDMDASEEGSASYIAGQDMSLGSKLAGGGKDQSESAGQVTKLCPACNVVTTFVDGKCTNCDYLIGSTAHEGVEGIRKSVEGDEENPVTKVLLIVAIIVVVGIVLGVGIPRLLAGRNADKDSESESVAETYNPANYAGTLSEIVVDDALHSDIRDALLAGNAGWELDGVDAYVYKYYVSNEVTKAVAQTLRINAYVGGDDAHEAVREPKNVSFTLGTADLMDRLNGTPGVEAVIRLLNTEGADPPSRDDVYIRYGYYYGKEHMNELEPIIEAITGYYRDNGEYPHVLSDRLITGDVKTKKGYYFVPNGIGYLPVFKADSKGNIIMGTGSVMATLKPEACIGYYLVKYTRSPDDGLDLHSKSAEDYYANKIAPFPYDPKGSVHNLELEPDGEPDGIACVVRDGVLVKD